MPTKKEEMTQKITVQDLLEAGVHFGHQLKRWNPKMKNYVYGVRNGIHIIDITKTMYQLADAARFLQSVAMNGGDILFVGTKRQAQEIVKQAAQNAGMFHISERWLGGLLTNNATIRKSINRMNSIQREIDDTTSRLNKKEISSLTRKLEKLHNNLDGISEMKKLPAAIVVVDICNEDIAVKEAKKLKIPIVGIVDTNGNPDEVDFAIPGNDDAIRSIRILISVLSDAVAVAADVYRKKTAEEKIERAKKKAEEDAEKEKVREEKKQQRAPRASLAETKRKPAPRKTAVKKTAEEVPTAQEEVNKEAKEAN